MRKAQLLTAIAFCVSTAPIFAQAAEAQLRQPSIFEGLNFALGLVAIVQLIAIIAAAGILRSLTANAGYFAKVRKMLGENGTKALLLIGFVVGSAGQVLAQTTEAKAYPAWLRDDNTLLLLALNAILLFAFIYIVTLIRRTIAMLMPPAPVPVKQAAEVKEESKIMATLTDAVPVEREHEIMMDHEYDGIRELDNNLPPWWVWMFYATIIFAVVYLAWYHVLPYSVNQHEQYVAEMMQAEEDKAAWVAQRGELVDETNVEFLTDAIDLKEGRGIFMQHCQACHAADGGGGVGPNLTDEYWIHGGGIKDVFGVVKYGVPAKGMIAWQAQLRPKEMAQVSSYILTLTGTTPAAPKEPQGEKWVAPTEAGSDADGTEEIDEQGGEADDTNPAETSAATAAVQ